ncbi:hypothetical protein [Streptomyces sp. NPDC055886]
MSWESVWAPKPNRDATEAEAERLVSLPPPELGAEVIRLVEKERVTQSSIAAALGMHRSQLNTKIQGYRKSGKWPTRRRASSIPAQGAAVVAP